MKKLNFLFYIFFIKILSTIYASERLAKACRPALHYTISQVTASASPVPGSGSSRRSAADIRRGPHGSALYRQY